MNPSLLMEDVKVRNIREDDHRQLNKEKYQMSASSLNNLTQNKSKLPKGIALLNDPVYITIDLDVLDPSIMPATGTPEPGGMDWYTLITYLNKVFKSRTVVGFDIVEFAPLDQLSAPAFLIAKLYYKMLSYKFEIK